jgi:hypothetical protein
MFGSAEAPPATAGSPVSSALVESSSQPQRYPPFQFTGQLEQGEIRLLRRLPSIEHAGGQPSMRFELLHNVALPTLSNGSNRIKYLALSYAWGIESNKIPIIIDGHALDVTRNLHAALVNIADEHEQLPLWTDAICIDQSNEDEKLAQIKQMSSVYSSADAVIIFLGLGTKSSDLAMEQVKILGDEALQRGIDIFDSGDENEWPQFASSPNREDKVRVIKKLEELWDQLSGSLFSRSRFRVRNILGLLDMPWFMRVWVVQELVMAPPGAVTFACGSKRVSYDQLWASTFAILLFLCRAMEPVKNINGLWALFRFIFNFWMQTGYFPNKFSTNKHAMTVVGSRRNMQRNIIDKSLRNFLNGMYVNGTEGDQSPQCREKVDRIRALASMLRDKELVFDLLNNEEGTQCWHVVYRNVARYLIIEQGYIDTLSLCRDRDSDLPSWAPDWSRSQRQPWSGFQDSKDDKGKPLFNAGSGTTVKVHNNPAPYILVLDGFVVDTIKNSTDLRSEWPTDLTDNLDLDCIGLRFCELKELLSRSTRYSHEEKEVALWKIPIGDKECNQLLQITHASDSSRDAYELIKNTLDSNKSRYSFTKYIPRPGTISYMSMARSMHRSRPFISATGYVGLCPSETRKEDVIFVPWGGHVPYIIRPKRGKLQTRQAVSEEQQWTLVGEAYVQGIMQGELDLANRTDEAQAIWLS